MNERREQENEQLHRGHALVEQFGPGVFVLLQQGAAVLRARPPQSGGAGAGTQRSPRGGALVAHRLEEGAAAAAAPRGPAVAQAGLVVALVRRLQQHPVQRVEQLGLGHAQLVLVPCQMSTWDIRTFHVNVAPMLDE